MNNDQDIFLRDNESLCDAVGLFQKGSIWSMMFAIQKISQAIDKELTNNVENGFDE